MKILGIDYGEKRIGIAVSSDDGSMAFPLKVIENKKGVINKLSEICTDKKIGLIVLGESVDYNGQPNPIMKEINSFKKKLEEDLNIKVVFHNETLSTSESIRTQGKNHNTDASAAAIILGSYLDFQKSQEDKKFRYKLRDWMLKHAEGPYAKIIVALNAFSEAIFFPIPPDVLLMAVLVTGARRWVYYSTLTTLFSVLGGVAGYAIGMFLYDSVGESIIQTYHLEESFKKIGLWYEQYTFLAVFISGFTPIPYKVFTIAAGVFKVNLAVFVVASIISRGARYFIIGYIFGKYGKRFGEVIYKYFNWFSIILVITIIAFFLFII